MNTLALNETLTVEENMAWLNAPQGWDILGFQEEFAGLDPEYRED